MKRQMITTTMRRMVKFNRKKMKLNKMAILMSRGVNPLSQRKVLASFPSK
jgi:hypothetical protein